jgi:predicted NAD/FAD-dependent oxidoreductase
MHKLAIVGAGVAGLAAARALRAQLPELDITVFEQSGALGGRVATRQRAGFVFDYGAQYIKGGSPAVDRLLRVELASEELFDIGQPVWVFDGAGTIAEGDPAQNAEPKWCYRSGLARLAELLGAGTDVRLGVGVARLALEGHSRWAIADADGRALGAFDALLLTMPAPLAAEILAASAIPEQARTRLLGALRPVVYRHCLAVTLGYQRLVPRPFYALVNTDRAHPISWLALEHAKGLQRCPAGSSLLIAQMAPRWSAEHWELPAERLAPLVASLAGDLLGEDLDEPVLADRQDWPFALPDGRADPAALAGVLPGLFFAGDALAGQGRVHLAIESGWRAAAEIGRSLSAL